MTYSFNEIEAMSKRAARGAGFDWGLAEEAGKATRWLSEQGFAGPETLAALLTQNDGRPYASLSPIDVNDVWNASTGTLCPLIAGTALCDLAARLDAGITLGQTSYPIFLVPFVATAAKISGTALSLGWDNTEICVSSDGSLSVSDSGDLAASVTKAVLCKGTDPSKCTYSYKNRKQDVDAKAWATLGAFAHRTYAPATEESRLAGAGAGLSDND